ncbi:acetyl-CoA synthetase-like protein [Daedaleopsis nitida]|nr:acetyl-CoA synthetase-like protein [Daedaleopsis nitida]
MSEIHADGGPLPPIPDDLTIAQFVLDGQHPVRPAWNSALRPWLIEEETGREIDSDELRARVHGLANSLKIRWNIGYDDVVCIFSPNHIDYVVALWGIQKLGGIVSTANPTYTADELFHQLQLSKACFIVTHSAVLSVAREAARKVNIPPERIILFDPVAGSTLADLQTLVSMGLREPQQYTDLRFQPGEAKKKLALLSFSSGTTGKPKAVMISHFSIIANTWQMAHYLHLNDESVPMERRAYRPGSVTMGVLPLYHAYGMHMVLFTSMYLASTVVVSPRFSLERMLQSIQRYRVTHLCLVPPQVVLLCKNPIVKKYDLSSVYFLKAGAAPVSAELTEQIVRIFPHCIFGQGYGMTEIATAVTFLQLDQLVGTPGSAGILLPGITARIVKQDGTLAGFNELGELHVKTPSMSLGYLDNPKANEETFYDGWIRTGDEVMINERKEVFVVDRIKELIKVRGFQVAPSELEGHLLDHPSVGDVCVVGAPDEYSGELPFAFVSLSQKVRALVAKDPHEGKRVREGIMKYVADHKTYYKWLAGVEFIDSVPKNPSGKLLRRVLRDRLKEGLKNGSIKLARPDGRSTRAKL